MYPDVPLWLSAVLLAGGFAALAWSSDFFVSGASSLARALGISPFIIGMVVIGFGTSAPELCVSALSGIGGKSNLSLGNAYGSCIFNIAAILGIAAVIRPIRTKPLSVMMAGPALSATAVFSMWLLRNNVCSRQEALALLAVFAVMLPAYCWFDQNSRPCGADAPGPAGDGPGSAVAVSLLRLLSGLAVLVLSSHVLVWGAVDLAKSLGVSDLMIGLTVVAVGTSLPELASAVASARRGENDFVLGNIVGSNMFNTLAVVGVAAAISPAEGFSRYILSRDLPTMAVLSLSISVFGLSWRFFGRRAFGRRGVVTRAEGAVWLLVFLAYTSVMIWQETHGPAASAVP